MFRRRKYTQREHRLKNKKSNIIIPIEKGYRKQACVKRENSRISTAQNVQHTILQRRILEFIGKSTNMVFLAQLFYYFNAMHE